MQLSVLQDNLLSALTAVSKAIESRPPLPVLANILLEATEDNRLRVVASNLQISITVWIGAKVDRPGVITLPARTFTDLISRLSKERVDLTLEEASSTVTVKCGATVSSVKGIAATEYPPVKRSEAAGVIVPAAALKSMILQTAFACAREDNRPILTGVYVRIDGSEMTLAAADGYRLAVRTASLADSSPSAQMVIPARALLEAARLMTDADEVCLHLGNEKNIVTLAIGDRVEISSQLLEGRFPDFAAIIPAQHTTRAVLDTQIWLKTCQTAEIFARDDAHSGLLKIVPPQGLPGLGTEGEMVVTGRSAERGHADNRLPSVVEGAAVDMHFDIRFLIEVLNVIDEDRVVFECNGMDSPGVMYPVGRRDFQHIIMPMTR